MLGGTVQCVDATTLLGLRRAFLWSDSSFRYSIEHLHVTTHHLSFTSVTGELIPPDVAGFTRDTCVSIVTDHRGNGRTTDQALAFVRCAKPVSAESRPRGADLQCVHLSARYATRFTVERLTPALKVWHPWDIRIARLYYFHFYRRGQALV
jgi:hypothetical protein